MLDKNQVIMCNKSIAIIKVNLKKDKSIKIMK